jgi:hypothetical protein
VKISMKSKFGKTTFQIQARTAEASRYFRVVFKVYYRRARPQYIPGSWRQASKPCFLQVSSTMGDPYFGFIFLVYVRVHRHDTQYI